MDCSLCWATRKKYCSRIKVLPQPSWVNVKWHSQMDRILDVLFVHRQHKESAHMVKRQLCSYFWNVRGREGEIEKGLHATPALLFGYMASCYSNMTLHSFSPAVFDQFSLLPLLTNLLLSWNASPLRLTFTEDSCHVGFSDFNISLTSGN